MIINLCPTGMIPTKSMTPHIPEEPNEIIDCVLECCDIGITMVHLHAREQGIPTWKPEIYHRVVEDLTNNAPELIICVSTSGRTFPELEKRSAVLEIDGIDMASLTLSSVNFNSEASVNSPAMIISLLEKMNESGVKPELEVFDSGMVNYAKYLIKKGLLTPPYYFNFILGNVSCMQPTLLGIGYMLSELPPDSVISMGGIGNHQRTVNNLAIVNNMGVRVGLEDNIWMDDERTFLATNAELVRRVHKVAEAAGKKVTTPRELRRILWKKNQE